MPSQTHKRRGDRLSSILDLVEQGSIRSQAELKRLLEARGYDVNQATLSRDIRELGIAKGPEGYVIPTGAGGDELSRHLAQYLLEAVSAQNQVVLRTPIGGAQPLALALDQAALPECVGTIAGDDTILVICAEASIAQKLATKLNRGRT